MFLIPSFQNFRIFAGARPGKLMSFSGCVRRLAQYGYGTGLFRSLVRLGFCWDALRRSSGFYRPVVVCLLLHGWSLATFWLFCCQLSWYGFMAWSLELGLALRQVPQRSMLILYTPRLAVPGAGRRLLYGVPVEPSRFVDNNVLGVSDLLLNAASRVVFGRRTLRSGVWVRRARIRGVSRFFYRSTYAVRKVVTSSVRALWPMKSRSFWFRTHLWLARGRRHCSISRFRRRLRGLKKLMPGPVSRKYRFVRKFRALFTVRALHTNLFFTIRQGTDYFVASTGMFEDLKHGTKRKRTLLAGWFLADRLFERASPSLKEKTIFRVDLVGRTSGRRGVWFSWRTKPWRLYVIKSRTPIAYNGTRGCRRRRL